MIKKLITEFFVQQSIPSAFDDSLTWYELISKIQASVNDIIDCINNVVIPKINEIIKDRNETIKQTINALIASVAGYFSKVRDFLLRSVEHDNKIIDCINSNNAKIISNFGALKNECDIVQSYSNDISKTLYNGTYNVVKFDSYDSETKTLKLVQTKTDFIPALPTQTIDKNIDDCEKIVDTIDEYNQIPVITSSIDEVTE